MKKYILFFLICAHFSCVNDISCCPYGFSSEDKRPFFEQYENTSTPSQTKEDK